MYQDVAETVGKCPLVYSVICVDYRSEWKVVTKNMNKIKDTDFRMSVNGSRRSSNSADPGPAWQSPTTPWWSTSVTLGSARATSDRFSARLVPSCPVDQSVWRTLASWTPGPNHSTWGRTSSRGRYQVVGQEIIWCDPMQGGGWWWRRDVPNIWYV